MPEVQRRYLNRPADPIRLRDDPAGGLPTITGYAAVFYREGDPTTEYEMWPADSYGPRVVERIMPRAFDRAAKEDDVRALVNHDAGQILGRNRAGTLRLTVDARGLRYEITPPDTSAARDLIESLRRGDITGSSFGFIPLDTSRRDTAAADGKPAEYIIERNEVQLFDVGPVTYPAYTGTEAGIRAAGGDLDSLRAEIEAHRAAARDRDRIALALAEMEMSGAS